MKTKKVFLTLILMATMVLLSGGASQAALQANPTTQQAKKKAMLTTWVSSIRQMEAADGAMGLSETIGSDLTATSESNGIDVHCMRSTEYGAMAILSASGYGNPSNAAAITTTTGNNTGVMIDTTQWEWTAGIVNAGSAGLGSVNSRYYDLYTTAATSAKAGDALGSSSATNPGCAGWHSASASSWINNSNNGFVRGSGGIFSFSNNNANNSNNTYLGRAVAVCGAGLLYRKRGLK